MEVVNVSAVAFPAVTSGLVVEFVDCICWNYLDETEVNLKMQIWMG